MSDKTIGLFLKISAVLWVIWGLVHMLAGVLTISNSGAAAIGGIADAVDPATLVGDYPAAMDAIINQHGFNLFWIGAVTLIAAYYIWKRSPAAIFIAALVGGLADIGYFIFMDLGGYVNFMPGTVMTLFSASAVILTFTAYFKGMKNA